VLAGSFKTKENYCYGGLKEKRRAFVRLAALKQQLFTAATFSFLALK
jgi:hypothetical protein